MKLTPQEEMLEPDQLFYIWLIQGKVDFVKINKRYVEYLENTKKENIKTISRAQTLLAQFLEYGKLAKSHKWVKDKAIGVMLGEKTQTTAILNWWKEYAEKNKIETNLDRLDCQDIYKKELLKENKSDENNI